MAASPQVLHNEGPPSRGAASACSAKALLCSSSDGASLPVPDPWAIGYGAGTLACMKASALSAS
ncbi:hypothetical protein, partial [Paenibacillus polymyxa]|uniref:hypothetical protein n=1 Tax=Paenibacillus polymyxa TaxID=1406 RepID=UPI0012DA305F